MALCQLESTIHPRCPTMYESQIESTAQPRCPALHENPEERISESNTSLSTLVQEQEVTEPRVRESTNAVDNCVSTRIEFQEVLKPLAKKSKLSSVKTVDTSISTLVEEPEKSESLPAKAVDNGKLGVMLNDFHDACSVDTNTSTLVEGQEAVEPFVKKSKVVLFAETVDVIKSKPVELVNIMEACTKKSELSPTKVIDKETIDTMLNDFVDA